MKAQGISNALYGLHRLTDSAELRRLAAALATRVEGCGERLSAQAVGNACYGMQGLSDSAEARALARALAGQVGHCRERLTAQQIGNALYGLARLSDALEARALLGALAPQVARGARPDARAVGNALYGLQAFRDAPCARDLTRLLWHKARRILDGISRNIRGGPVRCAADHRNEHCLQVRSRLLEHLPIEDEAQDV